jgi:hypothetical protein
VTWTPHYENIELHRVPKLNSLNTHSSTTPLYQRPQVSQLSKMAQGSLKRKAPSKPSSGGKASKQSVPLSLPSATPPPFPFSSLPFPLTHHNFLLLTPHASQFTTHRPQKADLDQLLCRHKVLAPKKGARAIAPKKRVRKAQEAKDREIRKRLTEGTERMLAEKAGRLEMLGGAENRRGKERLREKGKGGREGSGKVKVKKS